MPSILETYRRRFLEHQRGFDKSFLPIFNSVARDVARLVSDPSAKYVRGFNYDRARGITRELGKITTDFQRRTLQLTRNEMIFSWNLGAEKTTVAMNDYLKAFKNLSPDIKAVLPDIRELQAFMSNMRNAKTLSDSIWRISDQYRWELQTHLALGIMNGDSAADIAKRIQKYLRNPDDLFRRVRDKNGKLIPSQRMGDYHPGRGVYRSAYKNALRVARTETNRAYFMSDHNRWKDNSLVIGFKVFLSDQHPDYKFVEICEELAGDYPKEFIFTGWHPQCLCHVTPIMVDKADFRAYLRGEQVRPAGTMAELPENFKNFLDNNYEKLLNYKSVPYFIQENKPLIEKTMATRKGMVAMLHKITNADSLKTILTEIRDIKRDFNMQLRTVGDLSPEMLNSEWAAECINKNTLLLNAKHWNARNFTAVLTEEAEPTWFVNPTKKGIIDHELGHMVVFEVMETKKGPFYKELIKIWDEYVAETESFRKRVNRSTLMKLGRDPETYRSFFISGLAEMAPEEFIAESFTMVRNGDYSNKFANRVYDLMVKHYGKTNIKPMKIKGEMGAGPDIARGNVFIDFKNTQIESLETINIIKKNLDQLQSYYTGTVESFGIVENRSLYASVFGKEMRFNPGYFNDKVMMTKALMSDSISGWHPKGCTSIKYLIDHEYAHILTATDLKWIEKVSYSSSDLSEKYLRAKQLHIDVATVMNNYEGERMKWLIKINNAIGPKYQRTLYFNQWQETLDGDLFLMGLKEDGLGLEKLKLVQDAIVGHNKMFVSRYALKNIREFVAEGFGMALNATSPSPYAMQILDIINKNYKI